MLRRHLLLSTLATPALAQAWVADRPIRIIAPFAPGGASDVISRILAEEISPLLGQQVVVENRTGAGGSVGTEFAARARPDGLTLLMASQATHGVNPVVQRLSFDPGTDTTPIAALAGVPAVLITAPQSPVTDFAGFLEYVKARPGQLAYGSAGIGSSTHMTLALMAHRAGLDMTHVPYRGTALVIPDIIAGRVLGMADTINTALPFIRDGRVRALAVSTPERLAVLPDVPAVAERIPGYEVLNWYGLNGPAGLPTPIITTLHAALATLLARPEFQQRLASQGMSSLPMSTADYAAYIARDRGQWAELVRATGIRAD